jgi:hypothetical protein
VHHMEVNLPIIKDAEVDWKEWELKNWKPKMKKIPILGASLMKTPNSVIVKIWSKKVPCVSEIYRIAAVYSVQAAGYLKDNYGIEVAWWSYAVSGQHLSFYNAVAEKSVNSGLCVRTNLGRERAKIGVNDPQEEAWVMDDHTPVPGRETDCPEYMRRHQMMPEYVHGLFTLLTEKDGLVSAIQDLRNNWRMHKRWIDSGIETNMMLKEVLQEALKKITPRKRPNQKSLGEFA